MEWHTVDNLPTFYGIKKRSKKTIYVEIMLRDERRETACFVQNEDGTIYADTGYCTVDIKDIVKWRNIELF